MLSAGIVSASRAGYRFRYLIVATNVAAHLSSLNFVTLSSIWLAFALALIVASSIYFSLEVRLSLHALETAIDHLPGKTKEPGL